MRRWGCAIHRGQRGHPKGVVYSHRAIVLQAMAEAMPTGLDIGQEDVIAPVVPMFHVNAWGLPFTATLTGSKQVLPGPHLDPVSLLDLFEHEKVTITAGVPTILFGILQKLERKPTTLNLTPGGRVVVGGFPASG